MGRQHKMQLVPPDLENGMETYGEGLSVFILNGTPISVIICHDNRFPELVRYGNMDCQFFKGGIQNCIDFLAKNQNTQRKWLYFVRAVKKVPKSDFQSQCKKITWFRKNPLKNINWGDNFLLKTFWYNFKIWSTLFSWCYVYVTNTIISFEQIDFWPKIHLVLYPFLENSTTRTTILPKDLATLHASWKKTHVAGKSLYLGRLEYYSSSST